jgi:hypothetical protein
MNPIVPDGGYFVCCNVSTLESYDESHEESGQGRLDVAMEVRKE